MKVVVGVIALVFLCTVSVADMEISDVKDEKSLIRYLVIRCGYPILAGGYLTDSQMQTDILLNVFHEAHLYRKAPIEYSFAFFYDKNFKFVAMKTLAKGTRNSVSVPMKLVKQWSKKLNAPLVIIGHNHPSSIFNCRPSKADIRSARYNIRYARKNGFIILDDVVVNKKQLYSIRVNHPSLFRRHYLNIFLGG